MLIRIYFLKIIWVLNGLIYQVWVITGQFLSNFLKPQGKLSLKTLVCYYLLMSFVRNSKNNNKKKVEGGIDNIFFSWIYITMIWSENILIEYDLILVFIILASTLTIS
jgi:hypothetical protein